MRIATWNVNSLRSRIGRVEAFLERHDVDVLAVQETKAREDQLPLMGLQSLGYDVAATGTNQWNGVAIISRVGLDDVEVGFPDMPGWGDPVEAESRAIGATCDGVRIWSLYVPNGRKPDDPHYVYKLDWLARLRDAAPDWLGDADRAGRRLEHRAAGRRRLRHGGVRQVHPRHAARAGRVPGVPRRRVRRRRPPAHARARTSTPTGTTTGSASSGTAGMRIDFVLGSPSLADRVTGASIDRDERAGTGRIRPRPGRRGREMIPAMSASPAEPDSSADVGTPLPDDQPEERLDPAQFTYSVVIPVYNSEQLVGETIDRDRRGVRGGRAALRAGPGQRRQPRRQLGGDLRQGSRERRTSSR